MKGQVSKKLESVGIETSKLKKRNLMYFLKRDKWLYIMFLPVFIWYLIFAYIPMVGNAIAFFDYNLFSGIGKFIGLKNFRRLFADPHFGRLFYNTLMINVYGLIFGFPLPILLAIALNEIKVKAFKKSGQTISYLPYFLSSVVVMSIVKYFVSTDGPINMLRAFFGAEKINFLINPEYFKAIYISAGIWQSTGFSSIIYLASLTGIPNELYEAASIDGASKFQQMRYITLPSLRPVISIQLLLSLGSIMTVGHERIILLYNSSIYSTSDVFNSYVYRIALMANPGDYSYGQAVSIFQSVIGFILVYFANRFVRRVDGTTLW